MRLLKHTTLWSVTLVLVAPPFALADQVTMPFRLVTQTASETRLDATADPGRSISVSKDVGTAVFADGRIAHKSFITLGNDGSDVGEFNGYSTYVFENGDRLNLKFGGGWSSERVGGDYEVLSGTGAFEGATGSGTFDAAGADWDGAMLWNGQFILDMPGS